MLRNIGDVGYVRESDWVLNEVLSLNAQELRAAAGTWKILAPQ